MGALADALARGMECAWFAPQHNTWSEVFHAMVGHRHGRRWNTQGAHDVQEEERYSNGNGAHHRPHVA